MCEPSINLVQVHDGFKILFPPSQSSQKHAPDQGLYDQFVPVSAHVGSILSKRKAQDERIFRDYLFDITENLLKSS